MHKAAVMWHKIKKTKYYQGTWTIFRVCMRIIFSVWDENDEKWCGVVIIIKRYYQTLT